METRGEETSMAPAITIRQATEADTFGLRRLAALDGAPALAGAVLVAEQAGEVRAALGIADGRVVANPFAPTAALVEMLRMHRRSVAAIAA